MLWYWRTCMLEIETAADLLLKQNSDERAIDRIASGPLLVVKNYHSGAIVEVIGFRSRVAGKGF